MQISELDIKKEVTPLVEEAVKIVETVAKSGISSLDKRKTAVTIATGLYKIADAKYNFPVMVDSVALNLIPFLVDQVVNLFNNDGTFTKKKVL